MLRPRITACLLVHDKGLVKTVGFGTPKYVGDPINAVKIFNEKEVDELIVLDIDATAHGREPDYRMIENLAAESRMPLCYGGGVKTPAQARTIIGLGVEKVALSSGALAEPTLISKVANEVGRQSVVVVLDVKKNWRGKCEVWTHNAKFNTGRDPAELAQQAEKLGAGEIVVNSINNDGQMKGYDIAMVDKVWQATSLPMTVLGGAGSLQDIGELIGRFGIIGAGAGSLFVFKGIYKAVLINYPTTAEKDRLIREYMSCTQS
jgi:cyclase